MVKKMIEPKPAAEPAALDELPGGAGAGSGAGAGVVPAGAEGPSLPLISLREVKATAVEAGMTAPAVVESAGSDVATLAKALRCSAQLSGRDAHGDGDPIELDGAPSTAFQSAAAPLGSTAVDIGSLAVAEPAAVGGEAGPEGL
jgi:hypothetical protein